MTVLNPNDNFHTKKKQKNTEREFTKYGTVSESNVKWTYDFDPLKKGALIVLIMCLLGATAMLFFDKKKNFEQKIDIEVEAQDVQKRYFEKRLEVIKQETIAAEQKRIGKQKIIEEIEKPKIKTPPAKGPQIYSWINENGQKVFSNQPQAK